MVPMSEMADAVNEAVEKARESKLNTIIAACVAVIATFMSLCNVKASNLLSKYFGESYIRCPGHWDNHYRQRFYAKHCWMGLV